MFYLSLSNFFLVKVPVDALVDVVPEEHHLRMVKALHFVLNHAH